MAQRISDVEEILRLGVRQAPGRYGVGSWLLEGALRDVRKKARISQAIN